MKFEVTTDEFAPPPEQVVHLTLTPQEFTGLYLCYREAYDGSPRGTREKVEAAMEGVINSLHPGWQKRVVRAAKDFTGTVEDRVHKAFAS